MKKRVTTIHGKVIVSGGENPENELKNHEILLKEESDGTVDIKERNINGEVVSIAGGGSGNGSAISIPFYYLSSSNNNEKSLREGVITLGGTVPIYTGNPGYDPATNTYVSHPPYWKGDRWITTFNADIKKGVWFSYYSTEVAHWYDGNLYPISTIIDAADGHDNLYPEEEQMTLIAEKLSKYGKDINFMYYAQGTMGHISTDISPLFDGSLFAVLGVLYHYDCTSNTIQEICPAPYVKGLMLTMHEEPNDE